MTILAVDDNGPALHLLKVLLARNAYQVVTASNGAEALTKARESSPDLIVSDVLMPVMDGFTLCREWKQDELLRKIPFVFYTATYTDEHDREFALSLGAERFLVKPAVAEVFIRTIGEVIREAQHLPALPTAPAMEISPRLPAHESEKKEDGYLTQYNAVLIRKLESKMQQLERANSELERDIIERKRIDAELRKQQRFVEAVLASVRSGIIACDEGGVLTLCNRAAREMHQLPAEANPTEEWAQHFDLYLADGKTPMKEQDAPLFRALQGEHLSNVEMMIRSKSGAPRTVLASGQPIIDSEGRNLGAVVAMHDITERKHAQEMLTQTTEELRSSNQELERFAYVASHDLQEPLRMVSSYVELLGRRYGDKLDGDAREFIAFAVDGARRMQFLIKDLLALSRIGTRSAAPEPVDSSQILDQVLLTLRLSIQDAGATVSRGELPQVLIDPLQLGQVFQNLIINALKFHGETAPRIEVSARREGAKWEILIADNGIGIAPEDRDQIFVMFRRLHKREEYPGTGIGLAICKKIVERHAGRIWVDSIAGTGSVFHFTLSAVGSGEAPPGMAS